MFTRRLKFTMVLLAIFLVWTISCDVTINSLTNLISVKIQDTQQLMAKVQENMRAEPTAKLEVTEYPDGHIEAVWTAVESVGLNSQATVLLTRYSQIIVELGLLKNLLEIANDLFHGIVELEFAILLVLAGYGLNQRVH